MCFTTRWIQTEWRSVTPFDPLLAIRQKRGGEAPPEDPPKTRENRITAVGNDLYSADSRSFLNPFLRISRCARLFPLHPQQHPYPSNYLPRLPSPSASDPISPPFFASSHETCVEVSRALHVSAKRKLFCLANHTRSLLTPRIIACVTHTLTHFLHVAYSAMGNIDIQYSYLARKQRTSNHTVRYSKKIDSL